MPTLTPPTSLRGYVDESWSFYLADALEYLGDAMWPTSITTYSQMRRDSRLAGILQAHMLPIERASWGVSATGCRPEVARLVADDLGLPVLGEDIPGAARTRGVSWREHLRLALVGKLTFGHAGFELHAEVGDGQARLVGLIERPQATISTFHIDRQGQLLGVSQDSRGESSSPEMPAKQLAWYVHQREGSNWAGTSLLRPSYPCFILKRELMRVQATSIRRFGMGVPTIEWAPGTNPTPAQMATAQTLIQNARVGDSSGATLPPGASLMLRGLSGGTPDTMAFLRWLNQEMAQSVMASYFDLTDSPNGSRALGESFIDLFLLSLQSIAEQVADEATRQVAARIVEWNWGEDEPVPAVKVADVGSRREVTAEALNSLLGSGALSADPGLEAWVRREYRLPEREAPPEPPKPPARKTRTKKTATADQMALPLAEPADVQAAAPTDDADQDQSDWDDAKMALLAAWPLLVVPLVGWLAERAGRLVAAGDLAGLAALDPPAEVTGPLVAEVQAAATVLAAKTAGRVADQATAQGVTVPAIDAPGNAQAGKVAAAMAGVIVAGYATAAARKALQVGAGEAADVAKVVSAALDEIGKAASGLVADQLGAVLTAAQNAGRRAVLTAAPPARYVATERNDKHRCPACAAVDGREYATLDEALADYPVAGYRSCAGTLRCRGHIAPVWN